MKKAFYVVLFIALSLHSPWSAGMGVVVILMVESLWKD